MKLTHLKLDKFIGGDQKRIFQSDIHLVQAQSSKLQKSTIHDISDSIKDKLNHQVFYGNYSSLKKSNYLQNNKYYTNSLFSFNQIQPKYVGQKQNINIKSQVNANRYYTNLFQQNTFTNDTQDIYYFKANIEAPIDIIGVENVAYMISPLKNNKNVQIEQQETIRTARNFPMSADYKEHYEEMFNYVLGKEKQYPENNNIPLYDMNFSNLQTITFNTLSGLQVWLKKYKFDKLKYNLTTISSYITTNINDSFQQTYDSVNLTKLIQVLSSKENSIYFTTAMKKQMFKQLIDNIQETSSNCFLSKVADISKLSNKTKAMILSGQIVSSSFNLTQDEIYQNLKYSYNNDLFLNNIPNNSLYIMETVNPLQYSSVETEKPSTYINFVNLKNNQSPLQDFEIGISQNISNLYDLQSSNTVLNKNVVSLFDQDKTKSLAFNIDSQHNIIESQIYGTASYIPTKQVTQKILDQAEEYDNNLASSLTYATEYQYLDNQRLSTKKENYLKPFYQRHIQNNKLYQIGELYGLRSYLHGGILDNQQNIWLSYKYITSKNKELIDSYSTYYNLPFYSYQIDRDKNMETDYIGTLYQGIDNARITKQANQKCPYNKNGVNLGQQCFKCSAKLANQCTGYCSFPYNNQYLIKKGNGTYPNGYYWDYQKFIAQLETFSNSYTGFNLKNSQWFYFPCGSQLNTQLYAQTQISVSDDIQIYFSNLEYSEFIKYIDAKGPFYSSIFRGFGGKYIDQNYQQYLMINNQNVSKQNLYSYIPISSAFNSIETYRQQMMKTSNDSYLSALFNRPLRKFLSQQFLQRINDFQDEEKLYLNYTLYDILNMDQNLDYKGLNQITFRKLTTNKGFIKQVKKLGSQYYYNLYENNLFNFIKNIKIGSKTLQKFSASKLSSGNRYMYNNFVIAENCPFNGPHKIQKGTKLSGIEIYKDIDGKITINQTPTQTIRSNMNCYIRVVNWWSNQIKCQGKIKLNLLLDDNSLESYGRYSKILTTLNNFDQVQKVEGFFKASQTNYKKSNIYSIKVTNSGFNPQNDVTSGNFYQYILLKNYAYLDKKYKQFYDYLDFDQYIIQEDKRLKNLQYDDTLICKILYNANTQDNQLQHIKDIKTFYQTDKVESKLTIQNYQKSMMYSYIKSQNGVYKLNKELLNKTLNAKIQLRQIFQEAIKSSVKKYMPIHTDLWKIIYSGK